MPADSVDPDVDLHDPRQRAELRRAPGAVLGVIAVGGGLGALGRFGLASALPHDVGGFPWAVFLTNVSGCLLIGVLMVLITEVWAAAHPLLRPFLGTGVLGGYTTFSTYAVDVRLLVAHDAVPTALAYLAATLVTALLATYAGMVLARAFTRAAP